MINNIRTSVAVLKTASTIMIRNTRVLLMPIFTAVFVIGYIGAWLLSFAYLLGCMNVI
jgi:hypothetical protein